MTKSIVTPFLNGLTLDDFEIARAYHEASAEVQAVLRHVVQASVLTPPETDLLLRYRALTPERQALVDELLRQLGTSPELPPNF